MAADHTCNTTALLVIDMQNDFLLADSSIRVAGGLAIVPNVIKAVEDARRRGFLVVWVVREHDPLGRDVELFRRHFYAEGKPKPTSKGSKGAELVDGLVIKQEDYKVVKTRFSAFFATHLHSVLQGAGIDSLVAVGVQTPNCIRQTVFDAVALDYKSVTVIVDATAAANPDVHAGMFVFFLCFFFLFFFFFERPTNSIPSTLGAPTGQTEYSESNLSPPPIPGKTR
ncbi:putative N-carbamoylsarcosine amidase [Helianthus annuus]|nr:putative N-carbamoylsarcosine amidase [Helianthus annuus]